jgi:hypothetical protein
MRAALKAALFIWRIPEATKENGRRFGAARNL